MKFLRALHTATGVRWIAVGITAVAFCAGFFLHYFLSRNYAENKTLVANSVTRVPVRDAGDAKKFLHISPLLLCDTGNKNFNQFEPLRRLVVAVEDAEKNKGALDTLGFYFQDLKTGAWTGVGENEKFSPASLLKVPLMIAAFKYAESNPDFLSTQILYQGDFDINKLQTIKPSHPIEAGKQYTVEELVRRMVGESDNNATKLLQDHLPSQAILNAFTDIGFSYPSSDADYLSPKLYSYFFRLLYNASYLNRELSEKALQLLLINDFSDGIRAGVPSGVETAQKFGERTFYSSENGQVVWRELHDCGIVYRPSGPYLLCVMTKGKDLKDLSEIIKELSAVTYQTVSAGL
ncbi:serine hydrolase [Patescibacteria group bacterium]|nr:serine hydrolase [Patescibacteria group bacterium]